MTTAQSKAAAKAAAGTRANSVLFCQFFSCKKLLETEIEKWVCRIPSEEDARQAQCRAYLMRGAMDFLYNAQDEFTAEELWHKVVPDLFRNFENAQQ